MTRLTILKGEEEFGLDLRKKTSWCSTGVGTQVKTENPQ